jgi:hypothetical protein
MEPRSSEHDVGVPLVERVLARMLELDAVLERTSDRTSTEARAIDTALATAESLVTGDIEHPSEVVSRALVRWLDSTRNLGLSIDRTRHAA